MSGYKALVEREAARSLRAIGRTAGMKSARFGEDPFVTFVL